MGRKLPDVGAYANLCSKARYLYNTPVAPAAVPGAPCAAVPTPGLPPRCMCSVLCAVQQGYFSTTITSTIRLYSVHRLILQYYWVLAHGYSSIQLVVGVIHGQYNNKYM